MLAKLCNWLALADYQEAKNRATDEIIARFSRHNVSVQNGWHMDDRALEELSLEGDRAMANISSMIAKQTHGFARISTLNYSDQYAPNGTKQSKI